MEVLRKIKVPDNSSMIDQEYRQFLTEAHRLMAQQGKYFAPSEDVNSLELAHLIPSVKETVLAVYLGIKDASYRLEQSRKRLARSKKAK